MEHEIVMDGKYEKHTYSSECRVECCCNTCEFDSSNGAEKPCSVCQDMEEDGTVKWCYHKDKGVI